MDSGLGNIRYNLKRFIKEKIIKLDITKFKMFALHKKIKEV